MPPAKPEIYPRGRRLALIPAQRSTWATSPVTAVPAGRYLCTATTASKGNQRVDGLRLRPPTAHQLRSKSDAEGITPVEVFPALSRRLPGAFPEDGPELRPVYHHTHTQNHFKVSQSIFLALKENGYLYTEKQKQWYSGKARNASCPTVMWKAPATSAATKALAATNATTAAAC